MNVEAWPFLVSRNPYLDYRTIVAPDFICDDGIPNLLARAAEGDLTELGSANYRRIEGSKVGDFSIVFRVVQALYRDIKSDNGDEFLKDSFGREIYLLEGVVLKKADKVFISHENLEDVHKLVKPSYQKFWDCIDVPPVEASFSLFLKNNKLSSPLELKEIQPLKINSRSTNRTQSWSCTDKLAVPGEISFLVFNAEGDILAITNRTHLRIWSANKKQDDLDPDSKIARPQLVVPSPDGQKCAICYVSLPLTPTKNFIVLWDRKSDKRVSFSTQERSWVDKIIAVAISPNGQIFATGSKDGSIKIWDVRSKMDLDTTLTHTSQVLSIIFSPNGQILVSGYDDGMLILWNPKTGRTIHSSNSHKGSVKAVAFNPNGNILASADKDGKIKFWEVETLTELKNIDAHNSPVNALNFNPDGSILASASDDGVLKLWFVQTGINLFTSPKQDKPVNAVAFNSNGKVLISGGDDRFINIWQPSPSS